MKSASARWAVAFVCSTSSAACFDVLGHYEAEGGASAAAGGGAPSDVDEPAIGGAEGEGGGKLTASPEACDNGRDDDGDGLVDCQDSDGCGGFVCHAWPAEGWDGPLLLHEAGDDTPCPSAFPIRGLAGSLLDDETNACGCSCGAIEGRCVGDLALFGDDTCGTVTQTLSVGEAGACDVVSGAGSSARLALHPGDVSCAASAPARPPARPVQSCEGTPGGGCPDGSRCVRPMDSGTEICLYRPWIDETECPPGFDRRHLLVEQPTSSLSCTDAECQCDAVLLPTCAGSVALRQTSCGSAIVGGVSGDGACTDFTGALSFGAAEVDATPSGGSCRASSSPSWLGEGFLLCCATQI